MPRFKARKVDDLDAAADVLVLAQQTADRAIADAQREAEEILARARQEAEQIIADAKARAEGHLDANETLPADRRPSL